MGDWDIFICFVCAIVIIPAAGMAFECWMTSRPIEKSMDRKDTTDDN